MKSKLSQNAKNHFEKGFFKLKNNTVLKKIHGKCEKI